MALAIALVAAALAGAILLPRVLNVSVAWFHQYILNRAIRHGMTPEEYIEALEDGGVE